MITKIYEYYKILEAAKSIDDTDNIILLSQSSKKLIKLILYDYVNHKIIGYITGGFSNRNYYINYRVSSEKGWGPFMYSLLLQYAYPMYIKPSEMIKPGAIKVWQKFKDVTENTKISESDPNYTELWQHDDESEKVVMPEYTDIINTIFQLKPEIWFNEFVNSSKAKAVELKLNVNSIFKEALIYFQKKYYVTEAKQINIPSIDITDKYLLINERSSSIEFLIQDKGKIYGYAECLIKPNYIQIINIAAEKGYGPFLYDSIMIYLDKPIRPNRSLTTEALNIWINYFSNRKDVTKIPLTSLMWDSLDLNNMPNYTEKYLDIINHSYTIIDSTRHKDLLNWIEISKKFEKEMINKLPEWKNIRFNQGKRFFNMKYTVK